MHCTLSLPCTTMATMATMARGESRRELRGRREGEKAGIVCMFAAQKQGELKKEPAHKKRQKRKRTRPKRSSLKTEN